MAKKLSGSDYYWFLPGKKKPFTGTTLHVAEVLRVEAMENGCGDKLLRNLLANNQETHTIESRLAKERAAKRKKEKIPTWKALHEEILEQRRKETENPQ